MWWIALSILDGEVCTNTRYSAGSGVERGKKHGHSMISTRQKRNVNSGFCGLELPGNLKINMVAFGWHVCLFQRLHEDIFLFWLDVGFFEIGCNVEP